MQCPSEDKLLTAHTKGDQPRECQTCLDYLNICRLMVEPRTDSIASNQTTAMNWFEKLVPMQGGKLVSEMNLQEIFMYQKRFEALAAKSSIIYNEQLIKERIPNPKELERKSAEKAEQWEQAVRDQKDAQRPAKEKKILSDRDKAIAAYKLVGIPQSEATKIVDEQMAAIGRIAK